MSALDFKVFHGAAVVQNVLGWIGMVVPAAPEYELPGRPYWPHPLSGSDQINGVAKYGTDVCGGHLGRI